MEHPHTFVLIICQHNRLQVVVNDYLAVKFHLVCKAVTNPVRFDFSGFALDTDIKRLYVSFAVKRGNNWNDGVRLVVVGVKRYNVSHSQVNADKMRE